MCGDDGWVIWLTGLSGSGKSTLADEFVARLTGRGIPAVRLDGDDFRRERCADLGFSPEDRRENLRRAATLASSWVLEGRGVVASFISPYQHDRDLVRSLFPNGTFVEVYLKCPLEACEHRDPKGLYAKARRGELQQFTGLTAPYEEPRNPDLVLETLTTGVEECVQALEALVANRTVPGGPRGLGKVVS